MTKAQKKIYEYVKNNPKESSRDISNSLFPKCKNGEYKVSEILDILESEGYINSDNEVIK